MRKNIAITTTVMVISALLLSPAHAGGKNPKGTKNSSMGMTSMQKMCRATSAVGHQPMKLPQIKYKAPAPGSINTITFKTNCGDIVVATETSSAPMAVYAISKLARLGFFDQSLCHRLTTSGIFVLQCGDPTASGMGGPNFTFPDENLPANTANNYPAGTLAMANSGPNTNGSQFFIVYADTTLPPSYTQWGKVVKGLDIVKAIAAQGVVGGTSDGTPKQIVAIESVQVK